MRRKRLYTIIQYEGMHMNIFTYEPTRVAEWRKLVTEGQLRAGLQLTESIENYVVITLDAHTEHIALANTTIAIDYLNNINVNSLHNFKMLRHVGDQCLILAGLFPERAKRKNVSPNYFQHIGENAYYVLSFSTHFKQSNRALFYQLFENFSDLIKILKSTRLLNDRILF